MKVIVLTNDLGGLYRFRKELLKEIIHPGTVIGRQKKTACEVVIVAPDSDYTNKINKLDCRVVNIHIERRGINPITDIKLINKYRQILNQEKPDLVLTYTIKPNIYGGLLCRIKKITYIANITGLGTAIERGDFLSKILLFLYRLGLCSANTVFFQNQKNMSMFLDKKIVKNGKLIPGSGVNLEENNFERYPEEDGKLKFLFVGRIMKDKGIVEFLDCAEYIKKKYPFTYFDILGGFDEKKYQMRIENLHKQGIIHYYGLQKNVHLFMKNHHAIILPTYHEGMSNVLLESSATGRPVIATNIPGCEEAFENNVTGIGFAPRDSNALIAAVEKFILLPYEKKRQMGIEARNKISKEYDRKQVVAAYIDAMNIY